MTENRWAGLVLLALGAAFAQMLYQGFKDGNMTIRILLPAHRDRQPISFWFSACILMGWTALGVIGGLFVIIRG